MRIVIDRNIPLAEPCFGELGELIRLPGREIDAAAVRDADILIVRSITRVDEALVAHSRLRFVGTCTIGTDHIDQAALAARGIGFASAPGCNAEAVVDYVLSSLALLAERQGVELDTRRVGIVGVGNVGERLHQRLKRMGIASLRCDPPRAERERTEAEGGGFAALDELIERCDVLCLHTPLVRSGPHATHHLLDAPRVAALAPGTWLLNAGRGDCLDGTALQARLARQGDITTVLDVWENEPGIDSTLWRHAEIATPHIAGYSLDGKMRGTYQVYRALMTHFGLPARQRFETLAPAPALARLTLDAGLAPWEALRLCMRAVYDVRRDHDALIAAQQQQGMAVGFDACRTSYPLRREFATLEVALYPGAHALAPLLEGAGFRVVLER